MPKGLADTVASKMHAAYRLDSALAAQAALEDLARQLERTHPGAAGSLREGLEETLTVMRLGVPPTLARTLRSTNPIESMIEICRDHSDERETLARRPDGVALVRGGDARSHQTVPQGQRLLAPTRSAPSPRRRGRQDDRHTRPIR